MKYLAPVFGLLFLTSCVSYQHISLTSDLDVEPSTQRFYHEEKDIRISYDFGGTNFPVKIRIHNEGDSLVYVDLGSSVFTRNGQVTSSAVSSRRVEFNAVSEQIEIGDYAYSLTNGSAMIPPQTDIIAVPSGAHVFMTLYPYKVAYDPDKKYRFTDYDTLQSGGVHRRARRYIYSNDANKYGIVFTMSKRRDFSSSWLMEASFSEKYLYSTNLPMTASGIPDSQRFTVSKKSMGVFAGVMIATLIVVAATAPETEE